MEVGHVFCVIETSDDTVFSVGVARNLKKKLTDYSIRALVFVCKSDNLTEDIKKATKFLDSQDHYSKSGNGVYRCPKIVDVRKLEKELRGVFSGTRNIKGSYFNPKD